MWQLNCNENIKIQFRTIGLRCFSLTYLFGFLLLHSHSGILFCSCFSFSLMPLISFDDLCFIFPFCPFCLFCLFFHLFFTGGDGASLRCLCFSFISNSFIKDSVVWFYIQWQKEHQHGAHWKEGLAVCGKDWWSSWQLALVPVCTFFIFFIVPRFNL